jgi:DNA-binding protein YbaB
MKPRNTTPPKISKDDQALADFFAANTFAPMETSVGRLVHVTMDSRFQVTAVKLTESAFRAASTEAIEKAIMTAVNAAFHDVAQKNAERLVEFTSKQRQS